MLSYFLIGAGIWFLFWIFGGTSGGSVSTRTTPPFNTTSSPPPLVPITPSLAVPKPASTLARISDAAEKMRERSIIYRDDTTFELAYCEWFRSFKILVDARLETTRFRLELHEKLEKEPEFREIYEKLAGPTLTLEQLLNGESKADNRDRDKILHGDLPPPPKNDDPVVVQRQLAIYQRRLHEHDEYMMAIKKEFLANPVLQKLFFISIKPLPEEPYLVNAFQRHGVSAKPTANVSPQSKDTQIRMRSEGVSILRAFRGYSQINDLRSHGVSNLVHFTRAANLESILERGIMPVLRMRLDGVQTVVNDQERRDLKLDAISLSASFPNQFMFYKYRMGFPDIDWVVFEINPYALLGQEVAFYRTNAAHHKMRDLEISGLKDKAAVDALFDEIERKRASCLRPCDPTDVQAEIMLFGTVSPSSITGIIFETDEAAARWSHLTGSYNVAVSGRGQGYFGTRERYLS